MVFTVTARQSGNDGTTAAQSLTTSSATPTANSLFITAFGAQINNGGAELPVLLTPTGGGLTYTLVDKHGDVTALEWGSGTGFCLGAAVHRADVGGSPSAFTVVVDGTNAPSTGFHAAVCLDITGHNTSSPIVQQAHNGARINPESSSASGTVTLPSTPTPGNLIVVAFFAGDDGGGGFASPTAGAGKTFTTVTAQAQAADQGAVYYRVADGSESTTITCSDLGTTVGNYVAIAFEVAAVGGSSVSGDMSPQWIPDFMREAFGIPGFMRRLDWSQDTGTVAASTTPIGVDLSMVWDVRANIGDDLVSIWDVRAAVSDDLQAIWDVRAPIGDPIDLLWDTRAALGDTLQAIWDVRAIVNDDISLLWDTRSAVGRDSALVWDTRAALGATLQVLWDVRSVIGDVLVLQWDVRVILGDPISLLWDTRSPTGLDLSLLWDVQSLALTAGKDLALMWDTRAVVGDLVSLVWDVRAVSGDDLAVVWDVRAVVSDDIALLWDVRSIAGDTQSLLWDVRAFAGDDLTLRWDVHTTAGDDLTLLWDVQSLVPTEQHLLKTSVPDRWGFGVAGVPDRWKTEVIDRWRTEVIDE